MIRSAPRMAEGSALRHAGALRPLADRLHPGPDRAARTESIPDIRERRQADQHVGDLISETAFASGSARCSAAVRYRYGAVPFSIKSISGFDRRAPQMGSPQAPTLEVPRDVFSSRHYAVGVP
jgi:hypothetical protein